MEAHHAHIVDVAVLELGPLRVAPVAVPAKPDACGGGGIRQLHCTLTRNDKVFGNYITTLGSWSLMAGGGDSATLQMITVKIEIFDGTNYVKYNPYPNEYSCTTNGGNWSGPAFTNLPGGNTQFRITARMYYIQVVGGMKSNQSTTGQQGFTIP